jgi:bla regulator protein blaR1
MRPVGLRAALGAALALLACSEAFGQTASPARVFEVASIRPRTGPYSRIGVSTSGPRLTAEATTVLGLIMYAYGVKNFQVARTPALAAAGDTAYDVLAKAEGEGVPTKPEFRKMMQSLLADRFRLRLHREMRETPVYALTVGKNGPKFRQSAPGASPTWHIGVSGRNYVLTLPLATMDGLAGELDNTAFLDRPVVDRTRLTGTYEIKLTYTPENRIGRVEPDPAEIGVFTAVKEQLGLRLVSQKADVEYLVVDHVENPTAN